MTRPARVSSGPKGARLASLAALALGAVAYFRAAAGIGQAFLATPSSALFRADRAAAKTALRAEKKRKGKDDKLPEIQGAGEDTSFLGAWAEEDAEQEQLEEEVEDEALDAQDMEGDIRIADEEVASEDDDMDPAEAAKRGKLQETFDLTPARSYVSYIAKQNAIRVWRRHERDTSSLEVKIALATERIRDLVVHLREHRHDHYARQRLVMIIANRRKMLDKLSWKDVDTYLKVRDTLKIRHVYRIERLIGRLPEYVYTIRDRQKTPGLRTIRRMRKMEEKRDRLQKKKAYPLKAFQPKWKTSDREMREMTEYDLNKNTFQEG